MTPFSENEKRQIMIGVHSNLVVLLLLVAGHWLWKRLK